MTVLEMKLWRAIEALIWHRERLQEAAEALYMVRRGRDTTRGLRAELARVTRDLPAVRDFSVGRFSSNLPRGRRRGSKRSGGRVD